MALGYTLTRRVGNKWLTDILGPSSNFAASYWAAQGVYSTGRKPSLFNFRGDQYLVGCYSKVVYRPKQDRRYLVAGIKAPTKKISVTLGLPAGGDSGNAIMYITFLHKQGDAILAESDPSNYVTIEGVVDEAFIWTNIQDTNADDRVTHVRGYRSMNGGDFRMAWESPYGITTFTEATRATYLLGVGPVDHKQPPSGLFYGCEFAGRAWYANTTEHPYRIWASAAGNPQYVGEVSYRDTPDRSPITGIAKGKNELIVFTRRASLLVRAFDQNSVDDDWVLQRLDSSVGCVSHFSIVEIHNKLWFAAEDGIWIYDGSFYYAMRDMRPYWKVDYLANKRAFFQGFAADDIVNKTYSFKTPRDPAQTFEGFTGVQTVDYVGSYELYERSMGGQNDQPDWTIDLKGRRDSSILFDENGDLLTGSCDGKIRKSDATNGDDDGDSLAKPLILRHGHTLFFEPGGSIENGKTITAFWAYVESEFNDWTLRLLGGDEDAWRQIPPDDSVFWWIAPSTASLKQDAFTIGANIYQATWAAKSVHYFQPEKVSGRGLTTEIRATSPIGMKYRGFGGFFKPGPAFRPIVNLDRGFALAFYYRFPDVDLAWIPLADGGAIVTNLDTNVDVRAVLSPFPASAPIAYDVDLTIAFGPDAVGTPTFPPGPVTFANPDTEYIWSFTTDLAYAAYQVLVTGVDGNGDGVKNHGEDEQMAFTIVALP